MLPALVLTAGIGSRLDPLTRLIAKPAVPVAGRTLVERVLDWLQRESIRDVVLNLHHRPETITSIVGDGTHLGVRARYSWEQPLLGSAGGPRHALPLIEADTFLIVNGDTLCDFPLRAMLDAHQAARADVTMALIPNPAPDRYNSVLIDGERRVRSFVPKGTTDGSSGRGGGRVFRPGAPEDATAWHFIGVQIARASLFAPLEDGVPAETVSSLYANGVSAQTLTILGYPASTSFVDVGTPADYLSTALQLAGRSARVVEAGADVDASSVLKRTVVWPRARIGAGARLDDCIVAEDVHVPPKFKAARSVIVPAAVVTAADRATVHDGLAVFPITS